jgi:hypothetical protein
MHPCAGLIGCAAVLLLLVPVALTGGEAGRVKRIAIESGAWNGYKAVSRKLVIRHSRSGYVARHRRLDEDAIGGLLDALKEPPQPLRLAALGINQEWLNRNATAALGPWKDQWSAAQIDRFVRAFTDERTMTEAVNTSIFTPSSWTSTPTSKRR